MIKSVLYSILLFLVVGCSTEPLKVEAPDSLRGFVSAYNNGNKEEVLKNFSGLGFLKASNDYATFFEEHKCTKTNLEECTSGSCAFVANVDHRVYSGRFYYSLDSDGLISDYVVEQRSDPDHKRRDNFAYLTDDDRRYLGWYKGLDSADVGLSAFCIAFKGFVEANPLGLGIIPMKAIHNRETAKELDRKRRNCETPQYRKPLLAVKAAPVVWAVATCLL